MPELPEVEVTKRGIEPHIQGQTVTHVIVRNSKLRWPVPETLMDLVGLTILTVTRRAKYLQLHTEKGIVTIHLGMSGSLRVLSTSIPPEKHDHIDVWLSNGEMLRYNDPRRFGAWLWPETQVLDHLGPEPLTDGFTADYLYEKARLRKIPVKTLLMTNAVVVGVGNIYANESLFMSQILPLRLANTLSFSDCEVLVKDIKLVLKNAIKQGGTTLKDFKNADGKPGYFSQKLQVYGRADQSCDVCGGILIGVKIAQRATVYCPNCQK
jgi:formamidopyrimidine-DNA glycosylase